MCHYWLDNPARAACRLVNRLKQGGMLGIVRRHGHLICYHCLDGTRRDTQTPKRKARGGHAPEFPVLNLAALTWKIAATNPPPDHSLLTRWSWLCVFAKLLTLKRQSPVPLRVQKGYHVISVRDTVWFERAKIASHDIRLTM